MMELLEEHYLAVGTLGICGMLESIEDFFQGDYFFGGTVEGFPDVAVSTRA